MKTGFTRQRFYDIKMTVFFVISAIITRLILLSIVKYFMFRVDTFKEKLDFFI